MSQSAVSRWFTGSSKIGRHNFDAVATFLDLGKDSVIKASKTQLLAGSARVETSAAGHAEKAPEPDDGYEIVAKSEAELSADDRATIVAIVKDLRCRRGLD